MPNVFGLMFQLGAIARRLRAGHLRQLGDGLREQRALGGIGERRIVLVNPAVDAELVAAALLDRRRHLGCEREAHRRNEEGRRDLVPIEETQHAAESLARSVLAL